MRLQTIAILALSCALGTLVQAQTTPPPATQPGPGTTSGAPLRHSPKPGTTTELPASAASVKPDDAVITVEGACKSGAANGCVSSVTREQFEAVSSGARRATTADSRRNLASDYGRILGFADQARAMGLENEARFKNILQYVTDELLAQALYQYWSDKFDNQPDSKIEEYYKANSRKFLQGSFQRIIIPSQPAAAEVKKPTEEEEKAYVAKVRQQWEAGADAATLQKEALSRMGLNGSVPDVNLKDQTPAMFPEAHQGIFDMKPGEISQPFTDTGASYIYKMVSESEKPLSEVKPQIVKTLHDDMMRDKVKELSESVKPVLNEAYFGPEKKPETPSVGGAQQPGSPQQPGDAAAQSNAPKSGPPQK
jgi:hypothetical protein